MKKPKGRQWAEEGEGEGSNQGAGIIQCGLRPWNNQELPGCDGGTAVIENNRKELCAGALPVDTEITALAKQRPLRGVTKSSKDKCRRLTCPTKEKWI